MVKLLKGYWILGQKTFCFATGQRWCMDRRELGSLKYSLKFQQPSEGNQEAFEFSLVTE